ncbi:uncharacterized protein LOC127796452 isoform X1 [Diospyros lotus]|uniref:uncharacterized protein LOC127796452 isoform X1 n=1 Tax=Diospyros lotus TaxID=55363 RepID=UPI0022588409|nr:uncharacterized protein LOC127796452 isoform X1 [Diospyros lotus]
MMRRSFGGNGGMGGGGGMLRTVQRAVKASVGGGAASQDPFAHSTATANSNSPTTATYKPTTSAALSLSSSSPFPSSTIPISATTTLPTWPSSPSASEDFDWECVDGSEFGRLPRPFRDDFVFGTVPSADEVQSAVVALQQLAHNPAKGIANKVTNSTDLVNRASSAGTELDWIEPSLQLHNPRMLQPYGTNRVYDAFHLLQTEPCIQRMVISLSSDKAVWDAVLSNEVVRELRESLSEAGSDVPEIVGDGSDASDASRNVVLWIFNKTKAKVIELIEKLARVMNDLFQTPKGDCKTMGGADPFEEKLRASFLLSIVVLLIVVVSRAHGVPS